MKGISKCLFGGALVSAGIAANVQAQNFNFSYTNLAYAGAFDTSDYAPFDYGIFFGAGFFDVFAYVDSASGRITGASQSLSASGFTSAKSYLGAALSFGSYLTVDQNAQAKIKWDFSADEGPGGTWIDSYLSIFDLTTNSSVFFADLNNPIGSTQVALDSTHSYLARGTALSLDGKGESYWNVAIPTPGSAGLLGLAGIAATRRRRQ